MSAGFDAVERFLDDAQARGRVVVGESGLGIDLGIPQVFKEPGRRAGDVLALLNR